MMRNRVKGTGKRNYVVWYASGNEVTKEISRILMSIFTFMVRKRCRVFTTLIKLLLETLTRSPRRPCKIVSNETVKYLTVWTLKIYIEQRKKNIENVCTKKVRRNRKAWQEYCH